MHAFCSGNFPTVVMCGILECICSVISLLSMRSDRSQAIVLQEEGFSDAGQVLLIVFMVQRKENDGISGPIVKVG